MTPVQYYRRVSFPPCAPHAVGPQGGSNHAAAVPPFYLKTALDSLGKVRLSAMSSITFHAHDKEASVRGMERAMAGVTCHRLVKGLVVDLDMDKWLPSLLPLGHYLKNVRHNWPEFPRWLSSALTFLSVGEDRMTLPDGRSTDPFELALNTALLLGNDVVRFMARLHGQCEVHGWVDGPNRSWLAGIIREGRSSGLLREGMGWENVVELLEDSADGEVVTSYSVTDTFPNPELAGFPYDEELENDPWEEMGRLPASELWNRCVCALKQRGAGLEWRPDDWATLRFGEGLDAVSLPRLAMEALQAA